MTVLMTIPEYRHNSVGHEVQNCCCNTSLETWPQSKKEQDREQERWTLECSKYLTAFSGIHEVDLQIVLSLQYLSA